MTAVQPTVMASVSTGSPVDSPPSRAFSSSKSPSPTKPLFEKVSFQSVSKKVTVTKVRAQARPHCLQKDNSWSPQRHGSQSELSCYNKVPDRIIYDRTPLPERYRRNEEPEPKGIESKTLRRNLREGKELTQNESETKELTQKERGNKELAQNESEAKELTQKEREDKELTQKESQTKELAQQEREKQELTKKEIKAKELTQKERGNKELAEKEREPKELAPKEIENKELAPKESVKQELSQKESEDEEIVTSIQEKSETKELREKSETKELSRNESAESKDVSSQVDRENKVLTAMRRMRKRLTLKKTANEVKVREPEVNKLSSNLTLITTGGELRLEKDAWTSALKVIQESDKPLAVMLPWLNAKQATVMKYTKFYTDQGFDVIIARVKPWQLLVPTRGSQKVATELLEFLRFNQAYSPIVVHGFSVGGYLWGEVCVKMKQKRDVYQPVRKRIVGQVWDSVVDVPQTPVGFSRAIFPASGALQYACHNSINYYMRAFHNVATCHYIRSCDSFRSTPVKAPALFLVSNADPIGTASSNRHMHDHWQQQGIETCWKCWEESAHVGHYRKYPEEYSAQLLSFLERLGLLNKPKQLPEPESNQNQNQEEQEEREEREKQEEKV